MSASTGSNSPRDVGAIEAVLSDLQGLSSHAYGLSSRAMVIAERLLGPPTEGTPTTDDAKPQPYLSVQLAAVSGQFRESLTTIEQAFDRIEQALGTSPNIDIKRVLATAPVASELLDQLSPR